MFDSSNNYWDEPDFILTYIVTALVNGMGIEVGVTVTVRGLVMSGTLVSEQAYLDNLTTMLQTQIDFGDPDAPPEAREALNNILDLRMMTEFDPEGIFKPLTDQLDTPPDDSLDDVSAPLGQPSGDDPFSEDMLEDLLEDVDMPPPLQFAHLKDPLVLSGEPPVSFGEGSDVILRVRLTSIDSWMIGRLLPDMPDFPDFDLGNLAH
jgi:hypothetical protein